MPLLVKHIHTITYIVKKWNLDTAGIMVSTKVHFGECREIPPLPFIHKEQFIDPLKLLGGSILKETILVFCLAIEN